MRNEEVLEILIEKPRYTIVGHTEYRVTEGKVEEKSTRGRPKLEYIKEITLKLDVDVEYRLGEEVSRG